MTETSETEAKIDSLVKTLKIPREEAKRFLEQNE